VPRLVFPFAGVKDTSLPVVFLLVVLVAQEILNEVFEHGDGDDEDEGDCHDGLALTDGDVLNHLHEGDDQEVGVRQLAELLEKVKKDKVIPGVARGGHGVAAQFGGGFVVFSTEIDLSNFSLFA
jgi:hypothetical protein